MVLYPNVNRFELTRKAGLVGGIFPIDVTRQYDPQPGILDMHFERNGSYIYQPQACDLNPSNPENVSLVYDVVTTGTNRIRLMGKKPEAAQNEVLVETPTDLPAYTRVQSSLSYSPQAAILDGYAELSFEARSRSQGSPPFFYIKMIDSDYRAQYNATTAISGNANYQTWFKNGNPTRTASENPLADPLHNWPYTLPLGLINAQIPFETDLSYVRENDIVYSQNVNAPIAVRTGTENGVVPHGGSIMYRVSGTDAGAGTNDYCYWKLFTLPILITDKTHISFWRYVVQSPDNQGRIFIDGVTTDGRTFRDWDVQTYLCDQYGNRARPDAARLQTPADGWRQYIVNLSPMVGQTVNLYIGYDDCGSESGNFLAYFDDFDVRQGYPYGNQWYAEYFGGTASATLSHAPMAGNGAELIHNVWPSGAEWAPIGPALRRNIEPALAIAPDIDVNVTWTQLDRAHSLHFELLVRDLQNKENWLVYSANADNHWHRQGWVDMGPRGQAYNTEETFTRNVPLDYYQEYGVKATAIQAMRVSHFSYSGWGPGNFGGYVKDIQFGDLPAFDVTVQYKYTTGQNMGGTVKINGISYQVPGTVTLRTRVTDIPVEAATNSSDALFHSWSNGGQRVKTIHVFPNNTMTAFYKKGPSLTGGYTTATQNVNLAVNGWSPGDRVSNFRGFSPWHFTRASGGWYYWYPIYGWQGDLPYMSTSNIYNFQHPVGVYELDNVFKLHTYSTEAMIESNNLYVYPAVGGDPIISPSFNIDATAFSNGKKLAVDYDGKLHAAYTSGDTVFYATSSDDGETWSGFAPMGFGTNPAIELRTANTKGSSTAQTPSICYANGNSLYLADKPETGPWNQPQCVYQGQPDEEISYLSYVLNRQNNNAYVGWVSTTPWGSTVYTAQGAAGGQLAPAPIDQGGQTSFKSPSLALDKSGNLITAWSRDGLVKYSDPSGGAIELSSPDKYSIHPIVSAYGDRTSVTWMEQIAPAAKNEPGKYQIVTRERTASGWTDPQAVSFPDSGDAQFPVAAAHGQYVYAKETGDGNYDINYHGSYANGWETHVQNISYNSGGQSYYPDAVFRPSWPVHKLYIVWTEQDARQGKALAPVNVKMYARSIEPVPVYGVYPNTYEPSPYTIQRAGAFCYGAGQYQTVDYHADRLIYRFGNLDPKMKYQVKAVYYWSNAGAGKNGHRDDWRMMLKAGQVTMANTWVPETTAIKEIQLIPKNCYRDGAVDISIERKKGEYAICAGLELYAYEDEKGGHGGCQMETGSALPPAYQFKLMQSVPNPSAGKTMIGYQIASPSRVSLKVYNTLGQAVRTLVDEVKQPGAYQAAWNGKDDAGRAAAGGVYFYRLISGEKTDTKKMVVIR